ncbi:MAG: hypothetical protein QOE68_229 [Thermoanaerobaculia bacterium]|jgi:hypothetical protein|nr:hypothetical protein [Thermoanaerobaculia bacterium]
MPGHKLPEPTDVLYRIKRGLSAYVSYLAACEMNQAFSEYVLYEPILRILMARGFSVQCEYECPGIVHLNQGDRKRLDFFATGYSLELAIEVKWARSKSPRIQRDVEKLRAVLLAKPDAIALLCVFGLRSNLAKLQLGVRGLKERGTMVVADFGTTRFSCRIYQLHRPNASD